MIDLREQDHDTARAIAWELEHSARVIRESSCALITEYEDYAPFLQLLKDGIARQVLTSRPLPFWNPESADRRGEPGAR